MKVLVVFGTRPECNKMAPIVQEFIRRGISHKVCITGQHREMLDPFLEFWQIQVDYDLAIMKPGQDLYHVTTETLVRLKEVLKAERPDAVMVQGDTTTAFAASLASFYEGIPVAHVEAGLRTYDMHSPFPEEMNRRLTDHLSRWLFAPTERAKQQLLDEGLAQEKIFVTGNTIVDALLNILEDERFQAIESPLTFSPERKMILVTAHRRESFGQQFENLCRALRLLVENNPVVEVVYPVHLNPNVREPVYRILGGLDRVHLLESLEYLPFLKLLEQSYFALTDSGGVQEEAPTFGKPVLVMREVTERPEGIELGVAKLVGTSTCNIVDEAQRLLDDAQAYKAMCAQHNPYGDGHAARRIADTLLETAN